MRHRKQDKKFGRSPSHRQALMAALVSNLIRDRRITTTVAKAREARRFAERLVTMARAGSVAARRHVSRVLHQPAVVSMLFKDIAPQFAGRTGGYTRIVKLGTYRIGDGSELALLEWVGIEAPSRKRKAKPEAEKKTA